MNNTITCPNCAHQFEPTAAMEREINERFKTQFNQKWAEQKKKQDEENRRRDEENRLKEEHLLRQQQQLEQARQHQEQELQRRVEEAAKIREASMLKELTERLQKEQQSRMQVMEEKAAQQEQELQRSRQKELDFLRQMEDLGKREQQLELDTQRKLMEERKRITEETRKSEEERSKIRDQEHQMKLKELEKQLEDQRRLAEEALRKAEQGSMQLQGEVQELALEEMLRTTFPIDIISEVGKGMRGADCILTVRNAFGQECGSIIFESKRTQAFGGDWIDKLKADMVSCNAEIAVIVTQAMPKEMDRFGEKQGVYICTFAEAKSLVGILRQAVLRLYEARKSQENKGDKMVMLYDYLTGSEFMGQWNAMRESFQALRSMMQKERDDFEKNWKKKQKALDHIMNNSLQISGSIEGISGKENMGFSEISQDEKYLLD